MFLQNGPVTKYLKDNHMSSISVCDHFAYHLQAKIPDIVSHVRVFTAERILTLD